MKKWDLMNMNDGTMEISWNGKRNLILGWYCGSFLLKEIVPRR
jgi:hypothetical protein